MPRKKTDSADEPKKIRKRAEKKTEDGTLARKRKSVPKEKKVIATVPIACTVDDLLDCQVLNKGLVKQLNELGFKGKGKGLTYREAIICGQITKAVRGDLDSYKAIMAEAKKPEMIPLEDYVLGGTTFPMEYMNGG